MQIGVLFSVSSIANPFGYEYIAPLHPDGLLSLVQVNNSTPRLAIGTSWDQNASNPRGMVFISGVGTIDLNDLVSTGLLSGEIITSAQAVNDNFEIVAHTTHGRALFIDPFAASAVELVAPPNFAAAVSDMNNSGLMVGRVFPQGGATLHNAMVWDRFGNGVALQSSIAGVNYSHTEATTITESGLILGSVSTSIAPNSSLAFIWSSNGNALNFLNQVVSLAPGFTPVSFMDGVDDPAVAGGVRYLVEGLVGGAQLTEVYTIP